MNMNDMSDMSKDRVDGMRRRVLAGPGRGVDELGERDLGDEVAQPAVVATLGEALVPYQAALRLGEGSKIASW